MAANLECEIFQGEPPLIPENPTPWQVQMRWFKREMNAEGGFDRNEIRSWTVDAPSELVARTIRSAFLDMSDSLYNDIIDSGYQV